jgi:hypothetical protein
MNITLTSPCGHSAPFDDAWLSVDHFRCPDCGLRWHVDQGPAARMPSGFIAPGLRTVVIDAQSELPMRGDVATRHELTALPR